MAEVVSDSEPSPLEALRTGLNMAAALAVSDATSGTGIPPGNKREHVTLLLLLHMLRCQDLGCHTHTLLHSRAQQYTQMWMLG